MPSADRLSEVGRHVAAAQEGKPARAEAGAWGGAPESTHKATYSSQPGDEIRVPAFPMKRQDVLKWNGWGYNDSGFELRDGGLVFEGKRYDFGGTKLPDFLKWMEEERGISLDKTSMPQEKFTADIVEPTRNEAFIKAVEGSHGGLSFDGEDRLFRSHGHTCQEIWALRHGRPGRIPDAVIWPEHHDHVEAIVRAANEYDVVIIPFGGGTTVSGAVLCPEGEPRMIVSLDTSKMNRILWIDMENMMARIEAGVVGQALEEKLAEYGVCTGHTPDSYEFSTLGGWVATRASGMKKNIYGNIEDLVIRAKMVSPRGTFEKSVQSPRMSAGPDVNQMILGSEGTLGVVTEVTMKIRKLPEAVVYDSIVFPTFSQGTECLIEVAKKRLQPASIRLIDNEQFQFGRAMAAEKSYLQTVMDEIKGFYVTQIKGFGKTDLAVATLLFEGTAEEVKAQQAAIHAIAGKYGGLIGGEENGKRGYLLTFVIAYIRDIAFDYRYIAESFETACPHSQVENLCRNVKERLYALCEAEGVEGTPYASCRVTQLYDTGCCVYFYFGFLHTGLKDPMQAFHNVEVGAREEVIANGGNVSHHHGVGKVRKQWYVPTNSPVGADMVRAVKDKLDPKNIFAVGNLLD
mmetsp:Transcript_21955/g.57325  ORF Transcript_21955/g.57325 Transcript_21955/m.57325 type:complete len:629 (-) Transcript_21955:93-1979(-)|eukprot:CAMPEP_0182921376 /NCGR_PEP_ID=MMETSP0105_2-20130417/4108_1 /TAXON_ID=81532 ORGANISM="Acanthoeca-like sp., Strain 10tr" /NCGR_SAMPLE_ID=MMETSP0105_2 /ASSEMBLY_ACC=CAM_ASM_000205 /LENGTH=628 /DNA_ID=CAMNT_0025058891 /DNA_START=37 /DNA_END=1923 /DNA_ORIENTATION=+